jgi:hypothetical protein
MTVARLAVVLGFLIGGVGACDQASDSGASTGASALSCAEIVTRGECDAAGCAHFEPAAAELTDVDGVCEQSPVAQDGADAVGVCSAEVFGIQASPGALFHQPSGRTFVFSGLPSVPEWDRCDCQAGATACHCDEGCAAGDAGSSEGGSS